MFATFSIENAPVGPAIPTVTILTLPKESAVTLQISQPVRDLGQEPGDILTPNSIRHETTTILLTKTLARAIASAMMGAAAEL